LPTASSGFRLATDTLAVRLTLPLAGCVEDFHLQVSAPCRAHQIGKAPVPAGASSVCIGHTDHATGVCQVQSLSRKHTVEVEHPAVSKPRRLSIAEVDARILAGQTGLLRVFLGPSLSASDQSLLRMLDRDRELLLSMQQAPASAKLSHSAVPKRQGKRASVLDSSR
jgi:hypothetical protein